MCSLTLTLCITSTEGHHRISRQRLIRWNVGKSSSFGKASNALRTMFTNRVENQKTFGPQSHLVGPCFERWLKSCRNSAFQSTRSTTACPVLGGYPSPVSTHHGEHAWRVVYLQPAGKY